MFILRIYSAGILLWSTSVNIVIRSFTTCRLVGYHGISHMCMIPYRISIQELVMDLFLWFLDGYHAWWQTKWGFLSVDVATASSIRFFRADFFFFVTKSAAGRVSVPTHSIQCVVGAIFSHSIPHNPPAVRWGDGCTISTQRLPAPYRKRV